MTGLLISDTSVLVSKQSVDGTCSTGKVAKAGSGEDTTAEENKIDIMVYKLYELTYNEVKIIDPEIEKIVSKEKYNAKSIEEIAKEKTKDNKAKVSELKKVYNKIRIDFPDLPTAGTKPAMIDAEVADLGSKNENVRLV